MNDSDIENRIRAHSLPRAPVEWKAEILKAARISSVARVKRRRYAWGSLAACWLLVCSSHLIGTQQDIALATGLAPLDQRYQPSRFPTHEQAAQLVALLFPNDLNAKPESNILP